MGTTHVGRLLNRKVRRQHAGHHDDASEGELHPREYRRVQRKGDGHRMADARRRHHDRHQLSRRSGVHGGAASAVDQLPPQPASGAALLPMHHRRRECRRRISAFSAGQEPVPRRCGQEAGPSAGSGQGWEGHDLSRVPAAAQGADEVRARVLAALLLLPTALVAQNAELHVMPIRGNVFMVVGAGSNVTVSAGVDGVLVVDAGTAAMADKTLAMITEIDRATSEPGRLTTCVGPACYQPGRLGPFTPFGWAGPAYNAVIASPKPAKPIRWILQTTVDPEHTGGTAKLALAGKTYNGGEAGRLIGDVTPATVIGQENILKRMTQTKFPEAAWPTETYYIPTYKMSQYINGEGIQMYHAPAAIDDTDSIVYFRYSDVISAGDIYTPGRYPMIDTAKGGTVQGEIDALNKIIDIAFPEYRHQGGTMIVPGHGRLGDTADVAIYRNMVVVIRDRILDMKKQGMSLQQVKAAKVTLDYDGIYGTPDKFIEAVYQTLDTK